MCFLRAKDEPCHQIRSIGEYKSTAASCQSLRTTYYVSHTPCWELYTHHAHYASGTERLRRSWNEQRYDHRHAYARTLVNMKQCG